MHISQLMTILWPESKAVRKKKKTGINNWTVAVIFELHYVSPYIYILQTCVHYHIHLVTLFIQSNIFPLKSHLSAK